VAQRDQEQSVSVHDVVERFLIGRRGTDFCDACLADMLRVAERAAAEVASWLGAGPDFLRDLWHCGRCQRRTTVTRALFRHVPEF